MKFDRKALLLVFLILGLGIQDCHAERKKKVLVLHSYHQGLEWTDNITRGIQSVFVSLHKLYEIHYEYIDTKRNTSDEYVEQIANLLTEKNRHNTYAAVIVSDNNALKLINEGRIVFPDNTPIVFCGINNFSEGLIGGIGNVTGVVEETDHQATIEIMQKIHPQRKHVIVVLDRTPTGDAISEEVKRIESLYKGRLEFEYLRDFTLEEIPEKLGNLGNNDIIYLLTFNRDRNNKFISYTEGIEMIGRYADVPIYGSWDFYLGKGIVGGKITSGFHQGKEAAELALKVLQGSRAEDLPIVRGSPNRFMFDYNYMARFGIERSSLPSGSLAINSPLSLYEKHRGFLVSAIILLFIIVFILSWKFVRQQSMLKAKQELTLELEKKVQERTRELEKANKELKRLSNLDGLTQLYNRRYFDTGLKKEIKRLQRVSTSISLLLCDIDYFKMYNDTYGHLAGDDCIRSVADTIRLHCRRVSDLAARYGGEEFGLILPNAGPAEALSVAESIRREIESKQIPHAGSPLKEIVSISIGVATMVPEKDTLPSMIISLADKALYESKNSGRDRTTLKSV